jgi:hypothetical protein
MVVSMGRVWGKAKGASRMFQNQGNLMEGEQQLPYDQNKLEACSKGYGSSQIGRLEQ